MQIYTQSEIQALYEAQLSSIAQQAYVEPELEERLTSQIQAKRAELNAKRKDQTGTKTDKLAVIGVLEEELNNLIAEDAEIAADNETAKQTARETAAEDELNPVTQAKARKTVAEMVLRESDHIVAADAKTGSIDLTAWLGYRNDIRAWATGDSATIPDSPSEAGIDPEAETILSRIESQDDAILAVLEMMV